MQLISAPGSVCLLCSIYTSVLNLNHSVVLINSHTTILQCLYQLHVCCMFTYFDCLHELTISDNTLTEPLSFNLSLGYRVMTPM